MVHERLTLVVTEKPFAWRRADVLCVDSIARMYNTLGALDVGRIILDCGATAEEYLHLLANLPEDVAGDVVFLDEGGGGFLSATGRGGDRLMYALSSRDVDFYLETNSLACPTRERLALIA